MTAEPGTTFSVVPQTDIPEEILECKDPRENILWVGKPQRYVAYLAYDGNALHIATITGLVFLFLLVFHDPSNSFMSLATAVLGIATAFPFFLSYLTYDSTHYAISDRRVIIRAGIFATAVRSRDFDKISDVLVFQGIFEKGAGLGSVLPSPGGAPIFSGLLALQDHARLAGMLKALVVDVKTDWQYPNAKRPRENPGYQTTYEI